MNISIRAFGQLSDIVQTDAVSIGEKGDTDSLLLELTRLYPALGSKKFVLAVDKKTIRGNTPLQEGATVALLPPFSGG